jgi:hypothetical protein
MVHESTTLEERLRAPAFRELLVDATPVRLPLCVAGRGATTWKRLLEQERG